MPITSTQTVEREIKSLLFANDGSLNVVLSRKENGLPAGEEGYRIEAGDSSTLLDVPTVPGMTIRQQIVASVYRYLIDTQAVDGQIEA